MYLLNERQFVEKRLGDNKLYKDKGFKYLLIRYYLEQGLEKDEIVDKVLHYFQSRSGETFKELSEKLLIRHAVAAEIKKPKSLIDIDYIPISSSELRIVRSIGNKTHERYLFSLLCVAKYKNMINEKNDGWTHKNIGEVFKKVANVNYTQDKQYALIADLIDRGLIKMGTGSNLNIQVLFIDNIDETIKVDSFIDLGKFYSDIDKGKMIRCSECGKLVKRTGRNQKYCEPCSIKINIEKTNKKC